ncbi:AI-2E family transporter [Salipaludibacillus sp. HK11]|uniref:AI-2E family transporter n=1 Tax=Salipaludibacillus sp. HK11 TaxID=3394320 RepID=UPI0039FD5A6B
MINRSSEELKKLIYQLVLVLLVSLLIAGGFLFLYFIIPLIKLLVNVMVPFVFAGFIIYLVHPFVKKMESVNIPRPLSILFLFLLLLAGFIVIVMKGTPYVIREGEEFLEQLPAMARTYRETLELIYQQLAYLPESVQAQIDSWVHRGEAWIATSVEELGTVLMKILDWTVMLIVIPFIVFYGLKDYPLLKKASWYLTPKRMRKKGNELMVELDHTLGSYIRGQIIICFTVGLISWIGFWIIDMPYAVLLAIVIGLTNIIPYFGPILGLVPVILLGLTESFQLMILGVVIVWIVQIIEGNVLAPVIIGKSIHAHPLMIIFALILGNELLGFIGLILAVPIFATLKVLVLHWRKIIRERKGIYD